jgi:hypothetical protein
MFLSSRWPESILGMLTTKNVHFVKLSKCVTDFTIAFLSSRWSKKLIWNIQFGVRMRELCLQENIYLGYRYFWSETSWCENELLVLPVHDQNFRWLAEEGIVWCENELRVLDRYYRWSLTGSTGRCLFRI